jgi:hypothetical protein
MIIDSIEELDSLFQYMQQKKCLVVPILTDHQLHVSVNKLCCIYVYTEDGVEQLVPINHTEQIRGFSSHVQQFLDLDDIYIHDKKIWLQLGGNDTTKDVKTLWYFTYNEAYDESHYWQAAHRFYHRRHQNLQHVNTIIPIMQHLAMCQKIRHYAWPMIENSKLTKSYKTFNSLYPRVFAQIESNGMQVNNLFANKTVITDNRVYTNYHYHTSTGRPSNAFRGFNFAAMNKEDGTRAAFCSRFETGALLEMDFDAYHVRLIARLIGYDFPAGSIHSYFGKFYFDKPELSIDEYEQSKQLTFRLLYGGIDHEFLSIPFFAQVNDFISSMWTRWKRNGYIETALDKRIISREQFPDMTKNKLFNYYLQSLETEVSVRKIDQLQTLLERYKSCIILYTYDSVLFDITIEEAKQLIPAIKEIMEAGKLPVKCKLGGIYSKMNEFVL